MTHPRTRSVRWMSSVAAASLASAVVAAGIASPAQAAEDPRNRDFSISFRSVETMVNMFDEWNFPVAHFYRNDIKQGATYSYNPSYTTYTGLAQTSGGFSNFGSGWDAATLNINGPAEDSVAKESAGGTQAGLGVYPASSGEARMALPVDGNATPFGTDMIHASMTTGRYDLDPQPMAGQPGLLDPLDGLTPTTSTAFSRLVAVDGAPDRAALEVVKDGGTGTYQALNGLVTIEVVKGAVSTLLNSGDENTSATVEGATVKVSGPDQTVHTFEAADGRQELTFEDPAAPDLSLRVVINGNSTYVNAESHTAMAWASPVTGSYTNTTTGFQVSSFEIGNLYAETTVPAGGINITPQPDADDDGLNAYEESVRFLKDTVPDTDSDGLLDGAEVKVHKTDPKVADTDGDGLDDGLEVSLGTDPNAPDTDRDGLSDAAEVDTHHTNPLAADTDGDGLRDSDELFYRTDPLKADTDGDGLNDGPELNTHHSNPLKVDTDGDGLSDGVEVNRTRTSPVKTDTDGDGLSDFVEVNGFVNKRYQKRFTSNPLKSDSDGDGLRDRDEVTGALNVRFKKAPTNPWRADTDGDGVSDRREIKAGSNPARKSSTPRHR